MDEWMRREDENSWCMISRVRVSAWRGVDFVCGLTNEHE